MKDDWKTRKEMNIFTRFRKRIGLFYGDILYKSFPRYVELKVKTRKGKCLASNCKTVWICCLGCKYFNFNTRLCSRYKDRPIGCSLPPMDEIFIKILGLKCGYHW